MHRIRVIAPVIPPDEDRPAASHYGAFAHPEDVIEGVFLDRGPRSIESAYEDALATPFVLERVSEAEVDGASAVIVDCVADPGVEAAREFASIPIVGAGHAGMMTAALLAHSFSIIGTASRDVRPFERLVRRYGLEECYRSTRWVDIPVEKLRDDSHRLTERVVEAALLAVERDGAHAVVLGCTLMSQIAATVRQNLVAAGVDVPVVDPSAAALIWTRTLLDLGVSQSRRSYPFHELPEAHARTGHPISGRGGRAAVVSSSNAPRASAMSSRPTVIVPVVADGHPPDWLHPTELAYGDASSSGVDIVVIQRGPQSITSALGDALATPEVVRLSLEAEERGASSVVLDCMGDPGLEAAREAVCIPVLGPLQTSLSLAASVAHRITVLTSDEASIVMMHNLAEEYGWSRHIASIRCLGRTPIEIEADREGTLRAAIEASVIAVRDDGAHAIIPGCTAMAGMANQIAAGLKDQGFDVPVVEPTAAVVRMAEALADVRLSHSKRSWPNPPASPFRTT